MIEILAKLYYSLPYKYQKIIIKSLETYKLIKGRLTYTFVWPFVKNQKDINLFEQKIYSQNGEDGIIKMIFNKIGTTNKYCVELGTGDGRECNSRYLKEKEGWKNLLLDGGSYKYLFGNVHKEFITSENINQLLRKHKVPFKFDLLSIDIDYNSYWIWKTIDKRYTPRVIIVEYNAGISINESKAVKYDPNGVWDGTQYFGASLLALIRLGKIKGYTCIGCTSNGVNAFFIRKELINGIFNIKGIKKLYKPFIYKNEFGKNVSYPKSKQSFIEV